MALISTTPAQAQSTLIEKRFTGPFQQASDLITIYVGPTASPFLLHRSTLCAHSPHFASIFASKTSPPTTKIHLPNANPKVFRIALDFLNYHRLPVFTFPPSNTQLDETRWDNWNDLLIDLAIFANRFELPALTEAVFDLFFSTHVLHAHEAAYLLPDDSSIARACAELPENGAFLKFLADLVGRIVHDEDVLKAENEEELDLPKRFVEAVKVAMEGRRDGERIVVRFDACDYHECETAQVCGKAMMREWEIE